jgi:hypothetical protein
MHSEEVGQEIGFLSLKTFKNEKDETGRLHPFTKTNQTN